MWISWRFDEEKTSLPQGHARGNRARDGGGLRHGMCLKPAAEICPVPCRRATPEDRTPSGNNPEFSRVVAVGTHLTGPTRGETGQEGMYHG